MKKNTAAQPKNTHSLDLNWIFHGLFYVSIFSLALGQLGRFNTVWGGVYLHDATIALWLLLVGLEYLVTHNLTSLNKVFSAFTNFCKNHRWLVAFLIWVAVGWIGYSLEHAQLPLRGMVYAGKIVLYSLWGIYLVPAKIRTTYIFQGLALIATVGVLFGLGFFALIPDARFLAILGWDDHYFRFVGVHLDPNITGLHLVLFWTCLSYGLFFLSNIKNSTLFKTICLSLLGLTSLALLLTFSRAAYLTWLGAVAGITVLIISQKTYSYLKLTAIAMFILISICAGFFFIQTTITGAEGQNVLRITSIKARLSIAQVYLTSIKGGEWLTGTGLFVPQPSQLHADNRAFLPDSWPITLLVGTGLVGLGLWLTVVAQSLQLTTINNPHKKLLRLLLLLALFHALSVNSLFYGFTWIWLSLAVGLLGKQRPILNE